MVATLLIPGLHGSSDNHWQRHWARDYEDAGVVEQDDWACPVREDWQTNLDKALFKTDGAFLVAHSLGCLLVASYAGRELSGRIRGALLVAPCSLDAATRLHPCMIRFGSEPLDHLPFPSLVIGSLNDPYMSPDQLDRHARAWGSELSIIGFAGHINVESGFGRWREGYGLFHRLVLGVNRFSTDAHPASDLAPRPMSVMLAPSRRTGAV
jgi:uncharacterized protein